MVQDADIETLLSTGTWTTQRAKNTKVSTPTRVTHQSTQPEPQHLKDQRISRSFVHLTTSRRPPPPVVEDEAASVAKELGGSVASLSDEEPKFKGAPDQLPVLIPVAEYNAERRFVLVDSSDPGYEYLSDLPATPTAKASPIAGSPANITGGLDPKVENDASPELQKRKSRAELPRIETDFQPSAAPRSVSQVRRSQSATHVKQAQRDSPRDYFSCHPESAQPTASEYLSPNLIKHATKGRDRAYWDFNPVSKTATSREPSPSRKSTARSGDDRKGPDGYVRSRTPGPTAQRRMHSDMDLPRTRRTAERHSSYAEEGYIRTRNRNSSPSSDCRQSPPRLSRRDSSPPRRHGDAQKRDRSRYRHRSRPPPAKDADLESSSDEHRDHKNRHSQRQRRKSTVIQEHRPPLLSPLGPRPPPSTKPKSKPPSPLASPKVSQTRFSDYHKLACDPRTSIAVNVARHKHRSGIERPVSPISSAGSSSRSRSKLRADDRERALEAACARPRAPSRTPSVRSIASLNKSAAPVPLMSVPVTVAMPPSPTWSRQGSAENTPRMPSHWHTEPFQPPHQHVPLTPRHSGTNLEQSWAQVKSYRRWSEDVTAGNLPGFPDCNRQRPRAGYTDWLTLPRIDNLHICPSCYEQVFYHTEFRDQLVPAPVRSREREITCDMGASPWYRIAWLMTHKYRRADLRLFQGLADAFAKLKTPCRGAVRVSRTWYGLPDPQPRRTGVGIISGFTACRPCADAVQVLFPSLAGVFVPLDRDGGPRAGTCSLHFAPGRARFIAYFDALESAHDRAVAHGLPTAAAGTSVLQRLADDITFYAGVEECPGPGGARVRGRAWYTMASVPDVTVCQECFLDVVCPELVADADAREEEGRVVNSVARNFYQEPRVLKAPTTCLMATQWMRDLFRRACRREDGISFLDARVRDKLES